MYSESDDSETDDGLTLDKLFIMKKYPGISEKNFPNFSKKLVCIAYPGNVVNVDKMIETLGGINTIENAVVNPKKSLELKFRPENLYCKPCLSDRETKPMILLGLTIKKDTNEGISISQPKIVDYSVLGVSALTLTYNRLCDFQYLPIITKDKEENTNTKLEYIYDQIVPNCVPLLSWLKNKEANDMPLFLPPAIFSKIDTPSKLQFERSQFYEGRFKADFTKKLKEQEVQRRINKSSQEIAKVSAVFCNFHDEVPTEPPQSLLDAVKDKLGLQEQLEKIKKLFDERPIWSRLAVIYHTGVVHDNLKLLLPQVAYYYPTGPWRIMWVKYGYDPRKDGTARIYQSFDYRIRQSHGLKVCVKAKRNYTHLHTRELVPEDNTPSILKHLDRVVVKQTVDESNFILRPGLLPPARQMFYQYCDVHLEEIEVMLSRLPAVQPDAICHVKNGWLPRGFGDQCREIATRYVYAEMAKRMKEDGPSSSSSSTSRSRKRDLVEVQGENDESDEEIEGETMDLLEISDSSSEESSEDESEIAVKKDDNEDVDMDMVDEIESIMGYDSDKNIKFGNVSELEQGDSLLEENTK